MASSTEGAELMKRVEFPAYNGLVFLRDPVTGRTPYEWRNNPVEASDTGLMISALNGYEGDTTVYFGASDAVPIETSLESRWRGTLKTSGRLSVSDVDGEFFIIEPAPEVVDVEVWTNDLEQPDVIWIAIGGP